MSIEPSSKGQNLYPCNDQCASIYNIYSAFKYWPMMPPDLIILTTLVSFHLLSRWCVSYIRWIRHGICIYRETSYFFSWVFVFSRYPHVASHIVVILLGYLQGGQRTSLNTYVDSVLFGSGLHPFVILGSCLSSLVICVLVLAWYICISMLRSFFCTALWQTWSVWCRSQKNWRGHGTHSYSHWFVLCEGK